jgi:hypothetical protein
MATLEDVYPDEEAEGLLLILERRYAAMLRAVHALVGDFLGRDPIEDFRLDDADVRRILEHAAERVVRIDETTRSALRELLAEGQRRGLSNWEISNGTDDFPGIDGLFRETWKGRAELISRTEISESQRVSALDRYRASGIVKRIRVVDGDYDAVCANRNGKVVPLSQAPTLAHPACRLVVIPVVEGAA